MGHGVVRSQMDIRVCFRVRERKDVNLVLGQACLPPDGTLTPSTPPGKFLVSAPEHATLRRARGYLITDHAITETAARYAGTRPAPDEESLRTAPEEGCEIGELMRFAGMTRPTLARHLSQHVKAGRAIRVAWDAGGPAPPRSRHCELLSRRLSHPRWTRARPHVYPSAPPVRQRRDIHGA